VFQHTTEGRTLGVVAQALGRRECHLCNGLLADNRCTQATTRLTMGWLRWIQSRSQ